MYKFEKVDNDTTKLSYKDKTFEIKRNVQLLNDLQSVNFKAKRLMVMDLSKQKITTKNLIIKEEKGGKTYYDNSNLLELEKSYEEEYLMNLLDKKCKKIFNLSFAELLADVGITEENVEKFTEELTKALTGIEDTPS